MKIALTAAMLAVALAGCASNSGGGVGSGNMATGTRTAGQAIDDATIGTKLKAAIVADKELSALKVNVDTTQGNVKLRGEVKNLAQWRRAAELARGIEGVKSVDNQLVITG